MFELVKNWIKSPERSTKMKDILTTIIYTHNEEKNIEECIKAAKLLTNNIIVIDMESQDRTVTLARELGAICYSFPYSSYVEPAREFGIKKAKTDWVFILDADERMTKELAEEIKNVMASPSISLRVNSAKQSCQKDVVSSSGERRIPRGNRITYFKIPRKNIFAGKRWLKHGGWWPDYQVRLIKKQAFVEWSKEIHSTPKVKGIAGYLKSPILHYFHGDLEKMVEKTIIFEGIESDLLLRAGRTANVFTFFRKFLGELYRRMIKNLGFLDGDFGIIESIYQAFSKTITYLFLYEKRKSTT